MLSLAAQRTALTAAKSFAPAAARTTPAAFNVLRRNYHENIVEHYENPRNVGSLDKNDITVGTVSCCKCYCRVERWP